MRRAHQISSRLSWLPAWLFLAGLVLSQSGVAIGLLEVAKSDAGPECLDACPCEADAHTEVDGGDHGACPDGSHEGCPPACDECACCAGVAVALAPADPTRTHGVAGPTADGAPPVESPRGVSSRVFQPPETSAG